VILAGIAGGSFTVPMRYMPRWGWENYWTVYAIVALVIVPWLLAGLTVPSLASVYSASGPGGSPVHGLIRFPLGNSWIHVRLKC